MGFKWYLKYHVFAEFPLWLKRIFWFFQKPYDIVRYGFIKNKRPWMVNTHLPWSVWYDADNRMLYAIMSVFEQYYKDEHTDQRSEIYREECGPKEHWDNWKARNDVFCQEVEEIHQWWIEHQKKYKDIDTDERELAEKEEEMLIRIMKIRKSLWT